MPQCTLAILELYHKCKISIGTNAQRVDRYIAKISVVLAHLAASNGDYRPDGVASLKISYRLKSVAGKCQHSTSRMLLGIDGYAPDQSGWLHLRILPTLIKVMQRGWEEHDDVNSLILMLRTNNQDSASASGRLPQLSYIRVGFSHKPFELEAEDLTF